MHAGLHAPPTLYATGTGGLEPAVKPLWDILYANHADVILNGHDHRYERLARIDPNDNKDLTNGMRPIIAGTGGAPGGGTGATNEPNSELKIFGTAGVLRMDLSDGYYNWAFIAADGTANGEVMDSTANPADPNFGMTGTARRAVHEQAVGVVRRCSPSIPAEALSRSRRLAHNGHLCAALSEREDDVESETVLLAEDKPKSAEVFVRVLRTYGFEKEVVVVRGGAEALDYLFCEGEHAGGDPGALPHLVVLDFDTPRVRGMEVLRRIRSDECTTFLPVLMLSDSGLPEDVREAYRLGDNAFIDKASSAVPFPEVVRGIAHFWLVVNEPHRSWSMGVLPGLRWA